jgi:nucleoside-diphosphate-sugar epimerase
MKNLDKFFAEGVDAVVHTATCYGRQNEPASTILESNVSFPLRLVETCIKYKVKNFINTDTFFSSNLSPDANLAGYSASKRQFVEWSRIAFAGSPVVFANVRIEHLYGPGDHEFKFVSWVVRECLNNVKQLNLTSGMQQRDFIYVDDAVSAFCCLLDSMNVMATGYHQLGLGTGTVKSIRSFIEAVHNISGSTTTLNFGTLPYREHEQMLSVADNSYLISLGWKPRTDLKEGIYKTIFDMRKNLI